MHRQHVWHFEDTSEAKYAVKLGNNELYGTKKYIRYSREIAITLISTTNLSFGDQKSGYNFVRYGLDFVVTVIIIIKFDMTVSKSTHNTPVTFHYKKLTECGKVYDWLLGSHMD